MDKKSRELVMAKLYAKNKDYKMAEKSFIEYLSMNPEDANALKQLAQVYEQNKRLDKAFEMYERCYLAEPDRTGVLLDICRILLMNEVWMDNVDYRKWLNLAIKTFPTNPIVVNFKAFLSTLPPPSEEPDSPESRPPVQKSTNNDSVLLKILDKLSSMDKKIEGLEQKISMMSLNASAQVQPKQPTSPDKAVEPRQTSQVEPKQTFQSSPGQTVASQSQQTISIGPKTNFSFGSKQPTIDEPKKTAPVESKSIFSFGQQPATLNDPKQSAPVESKSIFSFGKLPANPVGSKQATFIEPKPMSALGQKQTELKEQAQSTPEQQISFNFSTPLNSSGNLFADSLKKFNLPSGYSGFDVSQQKEKQDENTDDADQNEELPIENTCEMEPIEIKTGEEDEDIVFTNRCKIFRLRDREYKERGIGDIKVLKHRTSGRGRLIMRRDAVGLVCLNCWDCRKIERVRDNQVRLVGLDASDGEPESAVLLIKFKLADTTETFLRHLHDLFPGDSSSNNSLISSPPRASIPSNATAERNTSFNQFGLNSFSFNQSKTNTFSNSPSSPSTSQSRLGASSNQVDSNLSLSKPDVELVDPKLDPSLVEKARQFQLPDLFYHEVKNQNSCKGCDDCGKE